MDEPRLLRTKTFLDGNLFMLAGLLAKNQAMPILLRNDEQTRQPGQTAHFLGLSISIINKIRAAACRLCTYTKTKLLLLW